MSSSTPTYDESVGQLDVAVAGGGPAGAAAARLLAAWGYRVLVVARPGHPTRALAESLPPSIRPVLAKTGMLDLVDRAGFLPTSGNTVWWGDREGQLEPFAGRADARGYQVVRPDFDRLLLAEAERAGAEVWRDAVVKQVILDDGPARLVVAKGGRPSREVVATLALDCSGRAGVIARQGLRQHQPGLRAQALVGIWHAASGWELPDSTHTIVETYQRGWGWSVPVSTTMRHVGLMIDGAGARAGRAAPFATTYLDELTRTTQLRSIAAAATLERAWACDASVYSASHYGGDNYLLVGDAGSFIEPLSSFGVKKALASAWVAAVAAHTVLKHPERSAMAVEFFGRWEGQVHATSLRRSSEYAREAHARHSHPFWARRAEVSAPAAGLPLDEEALVRAPDVVAAFGRIKASAGFVVRDEGRIAIERRPVIRNREIQSEEALALPGLSDSIRFFKGVDLVALRDAALRHSDVGEVFDAYRRAHGDVPLAHVLAGLSLLVARGGLVMASHSSSTNS